MIIKSQSQKKDNENGLYIVSTPIGNLKDITLRAIETLKKSSFILCEDTRVSKNLLDRYEIKSKLISNHKFNETKNLDKIINLLKSGEIISLISDAGTPSISDPGSILVNECVKNNIKIIPIPGASAVSTAVSISGFSEKFFFNGFLPDKNQAIINDLKKLSESEVHLTISNLSAGYGKIEDSSSYYTGGASYNVTGKLSTYVEYQHANNTGSTLDTDSYSTGFKFTF